MKKILIISILLLGACAPCPPDTVEECGKCVKIEKVDSTITQPTAIYLESEGYRQEEPEDPIPQFTKYKVSDIVCVWGEKSGAVVDIRWGKVPKGHDKVLVYTIAFPDEDEANQEFYETELERGKCNN